VVNQIRIIHSRRRLPHLPRAVLSTIEHPDYGFGEYSPSGRAVRASCARPAPARQRRDSDSPSGLSDLTSESVATASLSCPSSLADRPTLPASAFAGVRLTPVATPPYACFRLTDRKLTLSFMAFCATAPGDRFNFFAA
jgi:hypothetical protein